jgi:hypothetical protein
MPAACRTCDAPILWAVTTAGKPMPLDPAPAADGNIILTGQTGRTTSGGSAPECRVDDTMTLPGIDPPERFKSHFATCPQASQHRRKR